MTKITDAVAEFRAAHEAYKQAQAGYEDAAVEITLAKRGKGDMTLEDATKAQSRFTTEVWAPAYDRKQKAARGVLEALGLDDAERATFKGSL